MRLLDLFCGGGGAAVGYARAGFEVTGVDRRRFREYPFQLIRGDALEFLAEHGHEYDVIHASPPCQHHTMLSKGCNANQFAHPELIAPTRRVLRKLGIPYVIENVPSAPLVEPVMLCGEMFGLSVIRHRYFESNMGIRGLKHPAHRGRVMGISHYKWYDGPYLGVYGQGSAPVAMWQKAMGIDWIGRKEVLSQAIPPAYTEYIGREVLRILAARARRAQWLRQRQGDETPT